MGKLQPTRTTTTTTSGRCGASERRHHLLHPPVSTSSHHDHVGDLDEEDVWSVLAATPAAAAEPKPADGGRRGTRWTARGGLSLAFEPTTPSLRHHHHHVGVGVDVDVASSAPVKVPEYPASEEEAAAGEDQWVPPHEYVRQRGSTSSVFEGVGRTLKGRDLSRVRDAVWTNTGFFG